MKRLFMVAGIVALCAPTNALALSSWSSAGATDPSYNTNSSSNYDPSGGPVSASATNGSTGAQSIANAKADASTGTAGVQAYADPGYRASANASWDNSWTAYSGPILYDCSAFPCNFYTNITFHLDGVLDPIIVNGTNTGLNLFMDFTAHYYFGGINGLNDLWVTGGYDGGTSGPSMYAQLNGNDLTSNITYGAPNSNGDIPFAFDYTLVDWNYVGQSVFGSGMSMSAEVDNYSDSASHNIDAFHTFTVSYQSLDPGVTWISDSGQTFSGPTPSGAQVPEPSTLLLLGTGLTGLAAMRRFRKK